jgi:CheY-like chemotaxis protein
VEIKPRISAAQREFDLGTSAAQCRITGRAPASICHSSFTRRPAISANVLAKTNIRVLHSVERRNMGVSKSKNESDRSLPRIFIVDDEPILLELAQNILSDLPCAIQTFTNPQTALQTFAAAEKPPELIITDFAMHEMDGLELISECRRRNPNQKILMVSGTVDESIFADTDVKPDRFLAKPYQPAALLKLVRELLGN